MEKYYTKTVTETAKLLNTDINTGLSGKEAERRLKENGENIIAEKKSKNIFVRFVSQFNDFMIAVLLAAALISFITSICEGENALLEPVIILGIVVINAILGVFQEYKAEKSIENLKKLSAPHAMVIRDGEKKLIQASDVVTGDVLILEAGDIACADARIIDCVCLETDESGLTGESVPVSKSSDTLHDENTAPGDRFNMIMSSTAITGGKCRAIVTATGMDTEVGHIAGLIISSEPPLTPLQKRLAHTGKILGISALFICCIVFALGVTRKIPPLEMFINSVSLAVAAIPEGLPAIITIMLAIGVRKMAAQRAVMKNLPSVETLGSATVICADKTGTLTMNKMTVKEVFSDNKKQCSRYAALCCDPETKNPTELALAELAKVMDEDFSELHRRFPIKDRIAFTSTRKIMSTLHKFQNEWRVIVKGAPDYVLPKCTHYIKNSETVPMDAKMRTEIKQQNLKMAEKALRVICVATRSFDNRPDTIPEERLIFTGLIGMSDPPRPEAKNAVSMCKQAGIRPVMITGDHAGTAFAIAAELGISESKTRCITGTELDNLSEEDLKKRVYDYDVYARVTPLHKMRIVKAFQANGETVAMTGDGVNDAPALKVADIGCCPGKMGTDVARASADMIMTDDNFATIVEAVRQGRVIFDNIKKAVRFLLSSNLGEIITVFSCLLISGTAPLSAIALLWVNLVTDSFPATALSVDPPDSDIMNGRKDSRIFDANMLSRIITEGMLIGVLALLGHTIGMKFLNPQKASSVVLSVLSLSQLVHVFNMRSEYSIFKVGILKNKYLVLSFIAGTILQVCAVSIPQISGAIGISPLTLPEWGIVALLSLAPLPICELQKAFNNKL